MNKTAALKLKFFLKNEAFLCAALLLAAVSCFFVAPDRQYLSYIDWNTLLLLFSLMAVIKGVQHTGLFTYIGARLVKRASSVRSAAAALVFLPFFFSMLATNDVALITFVPFCIALLNMAGLQRLAVPVIVMQTLAANLGSMLTPFGNPQNLYLYARSGMSFAQFCLLMLPYTAVSGVCLAAACLFFGKDRPLISVEPKAIKKPRLLIFYAAGFAVCLLAVFGVIPPLAAAAAVAVLMLFADKKALVQVDYSLLLTFAAFFVFTGNLGRIEQLEQLLRSVAEKSAALTAVAASQIIRNVPAAVLLSGFTNDIKGLIVGCDIGGLGTLIASMASLISFKFLGAEYPEKRGRFVLWFTVSNAAVLALLLALYFLIER